MAISNPNKPMQAAPEIELRLALPEDHPAILEIRQHPQVASQQYPITNSILLNNWINYLTADVSAKSFQWSMTTILFKSKVVGHISESRTNSKHGFSVNVGWNLHPDYWGKGIMTASLHRYITQLVSNESCSEIIADCFQSNSRCLRLLDRLGFEEASISRIERFLIFVLRRCPHRVLRHRLEPTKWIETNSLRTTQSF